MALGVISSDPQRGWIIISLAPSHHCPGHSGELVRKRDSGDFGRPSCQQRCDPGPILDAVDLGIADDGECTGHEQAAQIAIPLFADAAEPIPEKSTLRARKRPRVRRLWRDTIVEVAATPSALLPFFAERLDPKASFDPSRRSAWSRLLGVASFDHRVKPPSRD